MSSKLTATSYEGKSATVVKAMKEREKQLRENQIRALMEKKERERVAVVNEEERDKAKQKYEEMDLEVALVLYLLLLVPGIIYTVHKSKQKKEITEYNKALQQRMDKILEKAKALL